MNILILTGSFGMGHNSAANAIEEKIQRELKGSTVYTADLFTHAFNSPKYDIFFRLMIKGGKHLYNYVYKHTEDAYQEKKLPFHRILLRNLGQLIEHTHADLIVSTLWSCSKVVSEYKQLTGSAIPLITCITDISSHNEWLHPGTDFYITAAPEVRDELIAKGIEPRRILVSGIPVKSEFKAECPRETSFRLKRLLIMGGGLGLLPKAKSFYEELDRLESERPS